MVISFLLVVIITVFGLSAIAAVDKDSSSTNESAEQKPSEMASTTDFAENESLTKEILIDRMLNTVDYFETVSVEFVRNIVGENGIVTFNSTIHTNIPQAKAYSIASTDESVQALTCDGKTRIQYNLSEKSMSVLGQAIVRNEGEEEALRTEPRFFVDEEGINHYFNRSDLTNGYLSSSCILPQGYTFGFLATDLSKWEIIGEKEYLNRKCVEISGKTESYGSKFNIVSFHMIVDEATGILLKLDGIDSEGNEVEIVTVSDIRIDDVDYTNTAIDNGLTERRNSTDISNTD